MEQSIDEVITAGNSGEAAAEESTPQPTENQPSEHFFRNFKTADDVVKAYVALEKEFTRKSQLLKAKEEPARDAAAEAEEFFNSYPEARELASELERALTERPNLAERKNPLEAAYLAVIANRKETRESFLTRALEDKEIREKVILSYLKNIPQELPRLAKGGNTPLRAPKHAKTLSEAGAEALQILKK